MGLVLISLLRRTQIKIILNCYIPVVLFLLFKTSSCFANVEQYVIHHVQNDNKDVVIFLRHLERFDNADGLHMLGIMYLNGYCGLGKSYYLANYYFKRAGEFGSALAWKDLADSYLVGHGVKKDEQLALEFYIKSAQLGCGSAQFNAGIMFKTGQGTKIDTKKACHYLRLASLNPDLGVLQLDADHHLREARIMHPR